MKKNLAIIFVTASMILILDSFGFGHAFTMFLLVGLIPGTNVSLNANEMLTFFSLMLGLIVGRLMQPATLRMARYFQPKAAILEK